MFFVDHTNQVRFKNFKVHIPTGSVKSFKHAQPVGKMSIYNPWFPFFTHVSAVHFNGTKFTLKFLQFNSIGFYVTLFFVEFDNH